MRVAHVITRMIIGGAQENTLYNCRDLQEDYGDEVLLITGPAIGPEGDLLAEGRDKNLQVEYISSLRREIHLWRDWKSYWSIKRALRNFKPDVVHTHSAKGGILGRLAAHSLNVPAIVHTVHGAPFHPYQSAVARNLFKTCERFAAKRCHAMISVADAMTELMVSSKIADRQKFTTIYSGMEVDTFVNAAASRSAMRAKLGFQGSDVVVGKIARLAPLKGHDSLVAAAEKIVAENDNVKFLLIGDGKLQDSLQSQIRAAGIESAFRFTGLIPPAEIPGSVAAMDMLVHTSLREGLARCLPQSLLAGVPVVAFDIDGAREVVLSGETGELIPPLDVEQLAAAVIKLAADGDLRKRLGEAGRKRFAKQFDHHYMTEQIRGLYESVLASQSV